VEPDVYIKDLITEEYYFFLLSCKISLGHPTLDIWINYYLHYFPEDIPDWRNPEKYNDYLDILSGTMFQMLVSFEFPYISCQQDSVLSLDVIISENYYMAWLGHRKSPAGF